MMFGWRGGILRVDLTKGHITEEPMDPKRAGDHIGGRGPGIYYSNKYVDPVGDPLSPEDLVVMATGPLTGTTAPTGARYMVTPKSPMTGMLRRQPVHWDMAPGVGW